MPVVMGDCELARPDLAGRAIDIDFRDHCRARAISLSVCDAATGHLSLANAFRVNPKPDNWGLGMAPGITAMFLIRHSSDERHENYRNGLLASSSTFGQACPALIQTARDSPSSLS